MPFEACCPGVKYPGGRLAITCLSFFAFMPIVQE